MPSSLAPSSLAVSKAASRDASLLASFAATAFRDTYRELDDAEEIEAYVREHFTPDLVRSQIDDPRSVVLLAHLNQELVGYAHVKQSAAPPCVSGPDPVELVRLYLSQGMAGKGHGAQLMLTVHAHARELKCRTIWLGVYDRNVRAVAFYEKFGFVRVGGKEFLFGGRVYIDPIMAAPVPV